MARTLAEAVGREELEADEERLSGLIRGNTDRLDDIDVKLGRVDSRLRALEENGIRIEARLGRMEGNIETIESAVLMLVNRASDMKDRPDGPPTPLIDDPAPP